MTQPKKHQYERKQQCRQQTHASLLYLNLEVTGSIRQIKMAGQ